MPRVILCASSSETTSYSRKKKGGTQERKDDKRKKLETHKWCCARGVLSATPLGGIRQNEGFSVVLVDAITSGVSWYDNPATPRIIGRKLARGDGGLEGANIRNS